MMLWDAIPVHSVIGQWGMGWDKGALFNLELPTPFSLRRFGGGVNTRATEGDELLHYLLSGKFPSNFDAP